MNSTSFLQKLHAILILSLLVLSVSGCSGASQQPASPTADPATATPAPSETPVPSSTPTPLPTETPTPLPTNTATATPDRTGTAVAQATQAAADLLAEIEPDLETYGFMPKDGHLEWFSQESVPYILNTYNSWDADYVDPDLEVADFVFQTEVTWHSSGGLAGCGFIFRGEEDIEKGAQYQFLIIRLSGLPAWWVERVEYGTVQDVLNKHFTTSAAIDQDQGATNKIAVVAKGNAYSLYANGTRMGTVLDSKLTKGNIGYYITQESGETKCEFKNSWVWEPE